MLDLLVHASLMLSPIDTDALKYVCRVAKLLQVRPFKLSKQGLPDLLLHPVGYRRNVA